MTISIDREFKKLLPPLRPEERDELEASIQAEGCRDALVMWKRGECDYVIVDGHNRHEICERLGVPYRVEEREFEDACAARIWMRRNQGGRRNLSDAWRIELALANKEDLAAKGREKYKATVGRPSKNKSLSTRDNDLEKHNTREELAKAANVATGTIGKADVVRKEAPELWDQCKREESTINRAYNDLTREKKRKEMRQRLDDIAASEPESPEGVFDVVVIDPPWQMEKIERDVTPEQVAFEYPTMSESELEALEIPCAKDCHVWLWTTHKHLPMALRIIKAWGMKYVCTFVWHKNGGFQPFGLPQYNCEFVIYARVGTPQFAETKAFNVCFDAPRTKHSEKPECFYDVVRRVTAGRRLDMFNRRKIDGFIGWGKEAK